MIIISIVNLLVLLTDIVDWSWVWFWLCGLALLMLNDDDDTICLPFSWLMIMIVAGWFEYGDYCFEESIVGDDVVIVPELV